MQVLDNFSKSLDSSIGKNTLPTAVRQIIEKYWGRIEVVASPETLSILHNKPVLLICNHPYELDIFPILGALPGRRDVYLVASANFLGVGPNIDKQIIPVYIRHTELESTKWSVWIGSHLSFKSPLPKSQSHARNVQAIKTAASRIKRGSLVVFSPEGPKGIGGGWGKGLGLLIVKLMGIERGYLVMAHAGGVTNLDHFRFIPVIRKLFPSLKVTFFDPIELGSIEKYKNPEEITLRLREKYYSLIG